MTSSSDSSNDVDIQLLVTARKRELARRLRLLLDAFVAADGEPYTYLQIADAVAKKGVSVSRPRWVYMLSGDGPLVDEPALLAAIAQFFEIDEGYLVEWGNAETPDRIEAQLEFVKTLRVNRITSFAARQIGAELSPDGLRAITRVIESEMNLGRADPSSK